MRNIRYLYDNAGSRDSFDTAFQLEGTVGTGELTATAVDTTDGQTSVLELGNTSAETISANIALYDQNGQVQAALAVALAPHAVRHLIVNELIGNGLRGIVTVKASALNSVMSVVMQYSRKENGGINYMFGIPAVQALGTVLRGSYNTYLEQESEIVLINPAAEARSAGLTLVRNSGEAAEQATDLTVPAHGLKIVSANSSVGTDDYGVVTVTPDKSNSLVGFVFRKRSSEYVMPTPIRQ